MSNKDFSEVNPSKKDVSHGLKGKRSPQGVSFPEQTASWGGLPGKTQPKGRSGGVSAIKAYPKSIGL